jgi:hypothetical protein
MGIRRDGRGRCGNGSWRGRGEETIVESLCCMIPFMYYPLGHFPRHGGDSLSGKTHVSESAVGNENKRM